MLIANNNNKKQQLHSSYKSLYESIHSLTRTLGLRRFFTLFPLKLLAFVVFDCLALRPTGFATKFLHNEAGDF